MLFKKKAPAPSLPSVRICQAQSVLYEGPLKDLPLKESVIIEKSIHFFDDPEPCYIHRGAVRARLVTELQQELASRQDDTPGEKLLEYAALDGITSCICL